MLEAASGGATFAFTGNGFDWSGGNISCVGTLTNTQLLKSSGTGVKYLSGTLSNQGTMTYTGSYFRFSNGTLNNSGTFDIQVDKWLSHYSGTNSVVNTGTFKKSSGTGTSTVSVPFDNGTSGAIDVQTGTLYLSSTFANFSGSTLSGGTYQGAGTLMFTGASIATNAAGITLNGGSAQIVNQSSVNALSGLATNGSGGTLTLTNGANLTTSGAFSNAGALSVGSSSTFTAGGDYTQTGGSTTLASGTLTAGTVDIQGGTLSGVGTVNGSVTNGGQVTPGASAGTLAISGNYTQSSGGKLNVEIGGLTADTQHDRLTVTGAAALDGTLDIQLINSFTPVTGNSFEILTCGSRSGSFSSLTGYGTNMVMTYGATSASAYKPSDKPVVTLPGGAASFTEGGGAGQIDAGATVTDADSPNLNGGQLTVDLTANGTADDRLGIRNEGNSAGQIGISGSAVSFGGTSIGTFTGGTNGSTPLVVTLNSSATPAAAQVLLRNVTFDNVSEAPSALARTVRAVLSDGGGGTSVAVTQTVNVASVNDNPMLATNAGLALTQGEEKVIGSAALQVTDVDNTAVQIAYTVTAVPAYGTLEKSGAGLSVSGTFTQQDVDNNLITYHHDNSFHIVDSFTATVADGAGGSIGATAFALNVDRAVSETSSAAGLSGGSTVAPGGEVQIFRMGMTGDGGVDVNSVTLTLSDLSSATGIGAGAFSQLKLYRSADAVLDGGDTQIGAQATVAVGSPTTIAATTPDALPNGSERFYIVSAVMASAVTDGQAFRVGFAANGASTSLGGRGSAVAAGDANKVTIDVVADRLVFTTQPSGSVSGQGLTGQPVVKAQDANGNVDAAFAETVTLTEGSAGSLANGTATAVSGVATFSGLTYTASADGESFTLVADDQGGVGTDLPTVSGNALMSDVVADRLVFTTQPSGSVSGVALSGQPVVEARDANGTKDTGFAEVVTLTEGSAGSLTNGTATASAGVATFSGLTYTASVDGESFTLVADDQGGVGTDLPTVSGNALMSDVVADRLVFTTQPSGSVSGQGLTGQPVVKAQDANGNVDAAFAETVTLTEGSAGSLANGTATAVSGVATFSGLTYTASADGESFTLVADDQGGVGTDLPTVSGNALMSDVVADRLVFTTQPSGSVSGVALSGQPVVEARDANGTKDTGFAEVVTLTEGSAGSLTNGTATASAGVATFSGLTYTASVDGESFTLVADDQGGVGTDLPTVSGNALISDVVATQLMFTTQPVPLTSSSGSALDFSVDPVVEARDANGLKDTGFIDAVTLTETGAGTATYTNNSVAAVAGVATFSGLTVTYTSNAPGGETFALRADDTSGGTEGDIAVLPTSSSITSITINSDGILTAGSGVSEPVALQSTANGASAAVPIFDFALIDGGASDGKPLEVSQVVVHTSGTGPFNKVVFRLSGPDASQVVGAQSGGLLTFSGLNISVANGQSETYAVDAYYSDASGLTDGQTLLLSIDGDVDLTVGANGTQMSGSNAPVGNGAGSAVAVVADRLVFTTQPGGSVSGSALTTQPVVVARDGQGNVDVDFAEVVTLSESSAGSLVNGTATAVSGVATFSGVAYTASADGESFVLVANDQDGVGTDLPSVSANALTADVVADRLVFVTQPAGAVSGAVLTQQPVVAAQDGNGVTDVGFVEVVTLSESSAGSLMNGTATAVSGVATFSGVAYTASADGESFVLVADDQSGVGTDLSSVSANGLTADVVADRLVFVTQPAGAVHGVALTTQPVVAARDGQGMTDVDFVGSVSLGVSAGSTLSNGTATAQSGIATFSGVAVSGAGSGRTLTAQGQPGQVTSDPFVVQTAPVAVMIDGNYLYKRYDGLPGVVPVKTQPAGVPVSVTYGGSGSAPAGPGNYEVLATATDPNYVGQARAQLTIDPPPPPTAALQASVVQGNPPLQVAFTDLSTGFIGNWRLETSDDAQRVLTDRSQPLTATYSQPGNYQAQLIVQGPGGQARTAVAIVVNGPPQVAEIGAAGVMEDELLVLDLSGVDAQPGSWSVEDADDQLIAGVETAGDVLSFTPVRDASGSDAVRIVRTNAHQLSASKTVTLTWTAVDDPPGIYPALDGLSIALEDVPIQVGGTTHARDVDTDLGTLAWSASGYDEALVGGVQGSGEGVVFSSVPNAHGETQAVIHLTDPATGAAATQTVLLRWTPVNDPPLSPVAVYPPDGASEIVLAPVISWAATDIEGSALSYDLALRTEGGELVAEGVGLTASEYAIGMLSPGTAYRCQVTVRDGEGASSQSNFSFTTQADRTPPAVSDVRAAATHEQATVSWRTDEEATGRVAYRSVPEDGTSVVSGVAEQAVSGVAHQVTLSGLLPAMWYEYEVVAVDGAVPGNASAPVGGRFRTLAAPDIDPPQIQVGPYVEGISQESAVVRWTTNELSTSAVRYWEVTGAGSGPATEAVLGEMVDDHLVKLEGLVAGTIYGYEVQSLDGAVPVPNASVVKSGDPFSTEKEKDKVPPAFEEGPAAQSIADRSATLLLRASELVRVQVRFDADADLSDGRTASSAQTGTEHRIALSGLAPETEYYYQVTLTDESGNPFASAVRSFATPAAPDTRPPGYLVPPGAESVTDVSAVLVLTADEPVRVQVLVAAASEPANTVLQESRELKEGHALLLTNLVPETEYAYEVRIEDGVPNRADPVTGGFRTEAAPDIDPPVVEGPFVEGVGNDGAAVVFRTDEPSTGEVAFHMAEGGTATGDLQGKIVLTDLAREHRVQLTQLAADRDYVVQVVARDGAQPSPNSSQQQQATFHTRRKPDTEPPQKVMGPERVEVTPTRALLQVGFNEPVELEVRYSVHADLSGAMMRTLTTRQKSHAVELVGLERETRYYVSMLARDAAGLEGELLRTELVTPLKEDGTPPRFVAMPVAIEVLASSARVRFAVDEPVTAELLVGISADLSDPLPVVRSTERSVEQELRVSGLQPRQTYYYRVTATNGGGQTSIGEGDFKTPTDQSVLFPRIAVGPSQRTVEDRSVTLYLRANKPSVLTVSYRPANDPAGEERTETQTVLQKEHTLVLTNLEPATRYTYTAYLEDELGKVSSRRRGRFTTKKVADAEPPRMQGRPTVRNLRHDQVTIFWRTNEAADSQVRVWTGDQEWNVGDGANLRGHRLTVTNLEGGKEYSYQVSSSDAAGNGPTSSDVYGFTTPSSPDRQAPQFIGKPIVKGRDFDSVVLSWSVDEPVSARISYGETGDFELGQEGRPGPESNWEWTLTGLKAETFYHVRISVDDARRNGPTLHELTVETLAEPDRQSPEIRQGPIAVATTQSEAVIEWTTDEPADGKVSYTWGGGSDEIADPEHVLEHRMVISGLSAGTAYSYTVSSQDIAQNPATVSGTDTFVTKKAPDTTPPTITSGPSALDVSENRATLFWTTDEPATSVVDYGTTTGYGGHLEFGDLVQEHRVSLEHLDPGTVYHFKVGSTDLAGHAVSTDPWGGKLYSVDHILVTQGQRDTAPPKFEQPPTVRWTNRNAVVSWRTDEVSTSRVDWVGGGKDGFVEDNRMVREHSLTLNRLRPRTGYRFMVRSEDREGNRQVWGSTAGAKWVTLTFDAAGKLLQPPGGAGLFVTDNFPDSQLPRITSGPQVQEKTVNSLTLAWETDELADSFVRFGIDEGLEEVVGAAQDVQDHRLTVTGLVPGTTYYYRVESTDPSGNGATESAVGVVTTPSEVDLSPPRFVTQPEKVAVTDEELVIGWETDEAASARVEYQVGEEVQTRQVMERQTRHQVTLTNLTAETEYRVRVFVKDASQNEGGADVELRVQTESVPDLEPPQIVSGPELVHLDDRSATLVWETDEVADSFVDYDATPYLGQVMGSPAYVRAHEMTLTNLEPGTLYHYRVGSRDRASNGPVESQVFKFTTEMEADVEAPSMPEGLAVRAGLDANWLTWEVGEAADLAGYVVYREDGSGTFVAIATNVQEGSYLDEGLEEDRRYRYRVSALDRQSPPNESEMSQVASGTPSAERAPGKPEIRGLEAGGEPGMPVVVLENAKVGDPSAVLTYTIQLSTSPDFSDVVDRAGNVEEGPGVTRWRVTRELAVEGAYWCRARASDGLLEGPWSEATMLTPAEVDERALSSDFDGDGSVEFGDFFLLAHGFGGTSAALDMDGRGRVDFGDFFLFADDFGKTTANKPHRLREVAVEEEARLELAAEAIDSRNILVQLRMDGMGKMAGYGARLSYDAGTLSFVGLADSSGRVLGGPELSLLLTKEQEGTLRLTEHLRGKLEGEELPEGQVVQLLFALQGRPEGSEIRVEEGYISRNHRQVVAVGQLGMARVVPQAYALYPAYPNPFNPSTTIPLALSVAGKAELEVYNVLGQLVRVWDLSGLEPGFHAVLWDGMDREGRGVGSGVYLVLLRAEPEDLSRQLPLRKESFRQTRKILLLR